MQRATLIMKINATVMMVCVRRCAVVCKVHMNMTGDGCRLEYIEGMVVNQRHNACDLGHDEQTQEPAPKTAGVLAGPFGPAAVRSSITYHIALPAESHVEALEFRGLRFATCECVAGSPQARAKWKAAA